MKIRRWVSLALLTFLLPLHFSCGYTRKTVLPREIKTVYVDTFVNKMSIGQIYPYEPGLEIKITKAIIRRLQQDGNLKIVSREKADAVLVGQLTNFDQEGTRFSGLERVEEYKIFLVTSLRLMDRKSGETLWEEPNFSGDASYFVTGPRSVSRGEAADRAVERLARNIVDRIVEDW